MSSEGRAARDAFGAQRTLSRRWLMTLAVLLGLVAVATVTAVLVGRSGHSMPAGAAPVLLASDVPGYHALPAAAALSVAATRATECAGIAGSRSRAFARPAIQGYEGMQSQAAATTSPAAAAAELAPLRQASPTACMTAALERIAAAGAGGRLAFGPPIVTKPPFAVPGANDDIAISIALTAATTPEPTTDYLELRGFVVGHTTVTLMTFSLAHGFPNILTDQLTQVLVRRATAPATQTPPAPTEPAPAGGLAAAIGIDRVAEGIATQAQSAAGDYADAHGGSFTGMTPAALHAAAGGDDVPVEPNAGMPYVSRVSATAAAYAVTVSDPANTVPETFTIHRAANGTITRTCTPHRRTHGACLDGNW